MKQILCMNLLPWKQETVRTHGYTIPLPLSITRNLLQSNTEALLRKILYEYIYVKFASEGENENCLQRLEAFSIFLWSTLDILSKPVIL